MLGPTFGDGNHVLSTSLRTRLPKDTVALANALMPRVGITACFDATADDILGVPVWFSLRPDSQVRKVHSGKGVRRIEAQAGALMEAIEFAVAERSAARADGELSSLGDVLAQFQPAVSIADLAPRFGIAVSPERLVLTDLCEDLATSTVYRMPAELLRLHPPDLRDAEPVFGSSSNGLASGNSKDEATLHALLEVLERDCHALDLVAPSAQWIDPHSLPAPFAAWSVQWSTHGVLLRVRQLPNDFGLPCFEARISEARSVGTRSALGWGLHFDPGTALSRAITEAAQSRLYALRFKADAPCPNCVEVHHPIGPLRSFSDVSGHAFNTVGGALSDLLRRLRDGGLPWVLRRPLSLDGEAADIDGLHVVKVVVPGCESALAGPLRIGRRLAQRIVQAAA